MLSQEIIAKLIVVDVKISETQTVEKAQKTCFNYISCFAQGKFRKNPLKIPVLVRRVEPNGVFIKFLTFVEILTFSENRHLSRQFTFLLHVLPISPSSQRNSPENRPIVVALQ